MFLYECPTVRRKNVVSREMERLVARPDEENVAQVGQREKLITPIILPDEEYVKQWQGKAFLDDDIEIITERGECVRSKSEKIIADKLFSLGIPYRYEYPLTLSGGVNLFITHETSKSPLNTRALDGMLKKLFCEE